MLTGRHFLIGLLVVLAGCTSPEPEPQPLFGPEYFLPPPGELVMLGGERPERTLVATSEGIAFLGTRSVEGAKEIEVTLTPWSAAGAGKNATYRLKAGWGQTIARVIHDDTLFYFATGGTSVGAFGPNTRVHRLDLRTGMSGIDRASADDRVLMSTTGGMAAVSAPDGIFLLGGIGQDPAVWLYDPDQMRFTRLGDIPQDGEPYQARLIHPASTWDGDRLLVGPGSDSTENGTRRFVRAFYPDSGAWETLGEFTRTWTAGELVVKDGTIWYVVLDCFLRLDPETRTFVGSGLRAFPFYWVVEREGEIYLADKYRVYHWIPPRDPGSAWPAVEADECMYPFHVEFRKGRATEDFVEVWVESSRPLRGVSAHINAGPGVPLQRTADGSWAKAMHVGPGKQVSFKAEAEDGRIRPSTHFDWP